VGHPFDWLVVSTALSVTRATFATELPGIAHYSAERPVHRTFEPT